MGKNILKIGVISAICGFVLLLLGAAQTRVRHDALFGLYADDHPQYMLKNGTRPMDAALTAPNFTSTAATGTAPYACTSTTVNTNLNADLLDGEHAAAFLQPGEISVTLTFADTTPGDCNSITVTNGLITAYTTVP